MPKKFWVRNEGQLVGTIGGVIIAILAAGLTYYFSQRQIDKKEQNAYNGLLYTLYVELYWQDHHFVLLKETLSKLEFVSIKNNEFVLQEAPMQFDLSITEQVLLKSIDYKHFNHDLVALLTSYQNQVRDINYFLDFNKASYLLRNLNDDVEKKKRISDYFSVLKNEYINKTQPVIADLREIIKNELKDYPKEKLNLE